MREPLDPQVALLQVLIAALIGIAAGLGRARLQTQEGASPLVTIWTAAMASMLGATLVLLTGHIGRATAAGFAVVAVATGAVPRRSDPSPLEAIAAAVTLLAYWAGAYVGRGAWVVAAAIAAGVAIVVVSVPHVEARLRRLAPNDIGAALTFGVVATVLFYALPAANLGPWGVWNPRRLWGLVVLISALSFAAFVVTRLWERAYGHYLAGAIGGLVSSTAVTVAFATQSRASTHDHSLAIGAGLSSLVMLIRVGVLAQAAGAAVVQPLVPFLVAMFAGGATVALWLMRAVRPAGDGTVPVGNPLRWQQAVRFAAFYALVKVGVEVALRNRGAAGVMWTAGLAGLVDVDAITLTLAGIAGRTFDPRVAATAISVAVLANTAAKLGYAVVRGDRAFGRGLGPVLGAALVAGAAALALTT